MAASRRASSSTPREHPRRADVFEDGRSPPGKDVVGHYPFVCAGDFWGSRSPALCWEGGMWLVCDPDLSTAERHAVADAERAGRAAAVAGADDWPGDAYSRGAPQWHAFQRGWRGFHRDQQAEQAFRRWLG